MKDKHFLSTLVRDGTYDVTQTAQSHQWRNTSDALAGRSRSCPPLCSVVLVDQKRAKQQVTCPSMLHKFNVYCAAQWMLRMHLSKWISILNQNDRLHNKDELRLLEQQEVAPAKASHWAYSQLAFPHLAYSHLAFTRLAYSHLAFSHLASWNLVSFLMSTQE